MKRVRTLHTYQRMVDEWIDTIGNGYFPPTTNVCLLAEEVGELSRLVSRSYGEQVFKAGEEPHDLKAALADEMADVVFIITCLANDFGINLQHALLDNIEKKTKRDSNRYLQLNFEQSGQH